MTNIWRAQTVLTGVAGSSYYSNLFWDLSHSDEQVVALTAEFWEIIDQFMVNEVTWQVSGVVQVIDDVTGSVVGAAVTDAVSGTGEASGEMLPAATQALVKWRTGVYTAGREIRGRTFLPALDQFMNVEGILDPIVRAQLSDELATWLGGLAATPLIWSRTHGESWPVGAAEVWEQFAVLRSRRD